MADTVNKLQIVYGDATLGVRGEDFRYIFSYATGGLESLHAMGKEWLYRSPRPTFWRAVTDNDRGNGFPLRSGMWLSADMFIRTAEIRVKIDGEEIPLPIAPENNQYSQDSYAEKAEVIYTYETISTPAALVTVSYCVSHTGRIRCDVHYEGREGLPELPVFGMRFIMPTAADGYRYEGLSGETYPDRRAGGKKGIYEVEGLPVAPYLVPQECGMHVETEWAEIYRTTELDNRRKEWKRTGLRIGMNDKPFAFSCLPYTAVELENATHQEELPPVRRTVLCVLGAVRGVGGIDSWGADVEPAYRISGEEDIEYSFTIEPVWSE